MDSTRSTCQAQFQGFNPRMSSQKGGVFNAEPPKVNQLELMISAHYDQQLPTAPAWW